MVEVYKYIAEQNTQLQQNLEKHFDSAMELHATAISARVDSKIDQKFSRMESQMDTIIGQKEIQNGRVGKNEDDIECLQHETRLMRFLEKHPIPAVLVSIALFMALAYGYHRINFEKTVENTTGIVIEELDKR